MEQTTRDRLEAALNVSVEGCPRCKICDTQIGAAMTVLGPLLDRAEKAEAKLAAIRERAGTWTALAPADDWGLTPADTVAADCGRAMLAIAGPAAHDAHPGDE
jgi:hypothetical protein